MTSEEIKKAVDEISVDFWNKLHEKSKEMFPDNQRSAWIFRGRVYQSLFANHFIAIDYHVRPEVDAEIEGEK